MWYRIWMISLAAWLTLGTATVGAETDPLAEIRTLTGQQKFAQAMRQLDRFLTEHPKNLDAKLLRGVILTRQGDLDAAITAFEQLALEHPALPEPHNNLAVLHASRRDYEKARVALLRAIELQPRYDTAHENLGDIYAKLATIEYEKAHKLNPDNTRAEKKAQVLSSSTEHQPSDTESINSPERQVATLEPPPVNTQESNDQASPKTCWVIGRLLAEGDAKKVNQWFDERDESTRFTSREEDTPVGYRVFIPPLESTAAADVQITRMRTEGVDDIIRISGGDLDNGIALGVYRTEAAAKRRITSLEKMGYRPRSARRMRRALVWYVGVVLEPGDRAVTDFSAMFPDYRLREVSCE